MELSDLKSNLYAGRKKESVELFISALDSGMDVIELYKLFAKILNEWECDYELDPLCIWKEHVMSSIVRTCIECAYPYVIKAEAPDTGLTCAVFCPQEEEHELGLRMSEDIFTLNGIKTVFAGKEVPLETFKEAIKAEKFDMVSISITNHYNLVYLCKFIEELKKYSPKTKVIASGRACVKNPEYTKKCGVDFLFANFDELVKFLKDLRGSK
ncbi:MAG: cobalamin B12-binding domain-containing protein [Athalassotoga sp.]|uniref:cobalamin B12-binding domain-containing protein n=1 Tax=Athalassotoga sp. TaxID=2022597 RepID=UPI003D03FD22